MTTPSERTNALVRAHEFLRRLAQPTEPIDVSALRSEASRIFRHYPDPGLVFQIARQSTWLVAQNPETSAKTILRDLPPMETAEAFIARLGDAERNNRRAEVRSGKLMPEATFRERLGVSGASLRRLLRTGSVFSIAVDGQEYYPDVLLEQAQNRKRLYAICRTLWPAPPEVRLHYLKSRRGNLGGLTPLQSLEDDERYHRLQRMTRGFALEYHRIALIAYTGCHESEPEDLAPAYHVADECDPRTQVWRRCVDAMHVHGYTGVFPPYASPKISTVFVNELRAGFHPPEPLARLNIYIRASDAMVRVKRFESWTAELKVPVEQEDITIEDAMRVVFVALKKSGLR